jgi:hypothetical protein
MKTFPALALFGFVALAVGLAGAAPSLTIYNQDFAVVRDVVPLDLKAGVNELRYPNATAQVEPDSVILRDPTGQHSLQILEQNYRNDPVTQELLLSLFEGKTISFASASLVNNSTSTQYISGRVVRSGYVPGGGSEQPIIEVNGKLQFSLPGEPRFPSLGDDTVLKPSFNWLLQSDAPGQFDAEIGYVTGGFSWSASYNIVAPETGDLVDIIGWVTIKNESGKTFNDAKIKVLAGDVNKIQPMFAPRPGFFEGAQAVRAVAAPAVTEQAFDEYHLYSIARPTTLRDRETKQVEFVSATGVKAPVIYVYDGADAGYRFYGGLNRDEGFGRQSNKKVAIMREFVNAETNHLGIALPAGKLRFYRRDDDGQLEFTGENTIDHTPRNETIHLTTGNAFDLVGERKQTNFHVDTTAQWMDETFEISLRNRKKTPVTFRVVEHLYRWNNWTITAKSDDFTKTDAQTIQFEVPVAANQERKVTYTVHYTW